MSQSRGQYISNFENLNNGAFTRFFGGGGSGWIVPPCAGGFFPFVFSAAGWPVNGLSAVGRPSIYGARGADDVV